MSEGEPEQLTKEDMDKKKEGNENLNIEGTNNNQDGNKNQDDSNEENKQGEGEGEGRASDNIFKKLGNMGSFGISDGIASGANYFTNTVVNSVTNIHDDEHIERDFKNKILEAIKYFNTEYTKIIRGDGDKSNDNRNIEITGKTNDAIKKRGQKIVTILNDTLGLFSNMDDDNFFNELNKFIKDKKKVKTLKGILSASDNNDIKVLFAGDHKHTSNETDNVDENRMIGEHGIPNRGGKRIKKRTKKNKKSSKKTKRNRK
jgi:hypothetical protein